MGSESGRKRSGREGYEHDDPLEESLRRVVRVRGARDQAAHAANVASSSSSSSYHPRSKSQGLPGNHGKSCALGENRDGVERMSDEPVVIDKTNRRNKRSFHK